MPSTNASVERPDPPRVVRPIVRRCHRVERTINWLLALSVAAVAVTAVLSLPFLIGIVAALGLLVLMRLPLVRRRGNTRLETDADPETVRAEFESATPPMLVFQWGLVDADDVTVTNRPDGRVVEYDVSYLFGLRSVTMRVETVDHSSADPDAVNTDDVDELELLVTVDGTQWASYTVTIRSGDGRTAVDVSWTTDHRVDLRQLLQGLVARRYYPNALSALGYKTVLRDGSWSL